LPQTQSHILPFRQHGPDEQFIEWIFELVGTLTRRLFAGQTTFAG
jgi:hypothetical protein